MDFFLLHALWRNFVQFYGIFNHSILFLKWALLTQLNNRQLERSLRKNCHFWYLKSIGSISKISQVILQLLQHSKEDPQEKSLTWRVKARIERELTPPLKICSRYRGQNYSRISSSKKLNKVLFLRIQFLKNY